MVRNLKELGPIMQKIVNRLTENQNLLKLLYYTSKDPLAQPDISKTIIQKEIFDNLILIVPRKGSIETAQSFISMRVVRGRQNTNNEFRDITLHFEVFVPNTQWAIKDENLRPFCILSEIQQSLNGKNIGGLGQLEGGDFDLNFVTDEVTCYETVYSITAYA